MIEYLVPIIVALLSLAGTLMGSYFANKKSSALISYRLEQLEKKVTAHNNLDSRLVVVETDIKNMKDEIRGLKK